MTASKQVYVWTSDTENLPLNDLTNFAVPDATFGPGGQVWRRSTAEAAYVHGRLLTGIALDVQIAPLQVFALGTDEAMLAANLQALYNAFTQFSYTLSVRWRGWSADYKCEPADWAFGDSQGIVDADWLVFNHQAVNLLVPHHPIPTNLGPF